jgi:hypothetical protein
MHTLMAAEVNARLDERRRDADRYRRVAAARRARRSLQAVPAWRVRLGRALITAGSVMGGTTTSRRLTPRRTGGAR